MRRFFLRAASALVVLGSTPAGCGSEEATRGSSAPEKTSRDSMLVQLPGWRNEGALLPIRRGHTVAPTANGTFHAWSEPLRRNCDCPPKGFRPGFGCSSERLVAGGWSPAPTPMQRSIGGCRRGAISSWFSPRPGSPYRGACRRPATDGVARRWVLGPDRNTCAFWWRLQYGMVGPSRRKRFNA